ncbi:MAG: hypothetical protein GXP36_10205, partial [Actinobacteria bacterium]|nr:hypothetical protein [Actinomycetota bacterium]
MTRWLMVGLSLMLVMAACSSSDEVTGRNQAAPGLFDPVQLDEIPGPDEWARVYAACMQGKGWNATIEDDGGVAIDDRTSELRALAQVDREECNAEMVESGVIPDPRRPPSEEIVQDAYDVALKLRTCLIENGYAVPAAPSWETFRESMLNSSEERPPWNPLTALGAVEGVELAREAHLVCEGD